MRIEGYRTIYSLSSDPAAGPSGFMQFYAKGAAGSEKPFARTSSGTVYDLTASSSIASVSVLTGTATITPSSSNVVYLLNSATPFTATLGTAVGQDGYILQIKNIGSAIVTIDANGSETIDGRSGWALSQWSGVVLVSYNGNWYII